MSAQEISKLDEKLKAIMATPTMLQIFRISLAASASQGIPKFMHRPDRAKVALEFADELIIQSGFLK
jgi:hypothetical protein